MGSQAVDGVGEQGDPAAHRPVPELNGYHALLQALGGDPLDDEARREERLPEQSDGEPHLVVVIVRSRLAVTSGGVCRRTWRAANTP